MVKQQGSTLASVVLVCAGICGPAAAAESILFQDTFSGTSIDATKWTTRTPCADGTTATCGSATVALGNEALALTVTRDNYSWAQAVSTQSFDNTVSSVEWETWQDSTSSWQGWPLFVNTPIAGFGWYNYQWGWTAVWRSSAGEYKTMKNLSMPTYSSGQHFKLKVQVSGTTLQWLYDTGNGSGYQLAHSTTDFSLPFYADDHPVSPQANRGKLQISSQDLGTTFIDNIVVKGQSSCDSTASYDSGYAAGKAYCVANPSACGMTTVGSAGGDSSHATYNPLSSLLKIPYVNVPSGFGGNLTYSVDLRVIKFEPLQFELQSATQVVK